MEIKPGTAWLTGESRASGITRTLMLVTPRSARRYIISSIVFQKTVDSIFAGNQPRSDICLHVGALHLPTSWEATIPEPHFKRKDDPSLPFRVLLQGKGGDYEYYHARFPVSHEETQHMQRGTLYIPFQFLQCTQKKETYMHGWEQITRVHHHSLWDPRISFVDPWRYEHRVVDELQGRAIDLYQKKLSLEAELKDVTQKLGELDPDNKIPDIHAQTRKRMLGAINQE